jgi:hypothetical protein
MKIMNQVITFVRIYNRQFANLLFLIILSNEATLKNYKFSFFSILFSGKALWLLTEDMFKKRVPNSGDILYKSLQNLIPKAANQNEGMS